MSVGALGLAAWTLVPLYWLVDMSVTGPGELVSRPAHLYPHAPTLASYGRLLNLRPSDSLDELGQPLLVRRGWVNSVAVAAPTTLATLLLAVPVGYALGRLRFRYRALLLLALVLTRAYPPIAVLIPFSALFVALHLQGTLVGLMIIDLTLTLPLVAWIMSGLFASLPPNVERAARVDGLTRWQALWRIMLPLAMPGIAACAVISFLVCWNEFTFALVLTMGSPAQTFPPTLAGSSPSQGAAVSAVGLVLPVLLALLFQARIRSVNIVDPL